MTTDTLKFRTQFQIRILPKFSGRKPTDVEVAVWRDVIVAIESPEDGAVALALHHSMNPHYFEDDTLELRMEGKSMVMDFIEDILHDHGHRQKRYHLSVTCSEVNNELVEGKEKEIIIDCTIRTVGTEEAQSTLRATVLLNTDPVPEFADYKEALAWQTEEWLAGRPWHNTHDPISDDQYEKGAPQRHMANYGECCPDFSCCNPELLTPKSERGTLIGIRTTQGQEAFDRAMEGLGFKALDVLVEAMAENGSTIHVVGGDPEKVLPAFKDDDKPETIN